MEWLWMFLTGAIPGFLATWLGIGGCFLRIPMMMALLGLNIKQAYCVNQAVIALTTIPGVVEHVKSDHIYKPGLIVAALSTVAGVLLGTTIAVWTPRAVLRTIFGVACFGVGIYMVWLALRTRGRVPPRVTASQAGRLPFGAGFAASLFLAGVATGVCGFGGGIYYVPVFSAFSYPMHVAIGTSSATMIATGAAGSLNLGLHGFMVWLPFIVIGAVTLLFSWLGARATKAVKAWLLRAIFGVLISIVGACVALRVI